MKSFFDKFGKLKNQLSRFDWDLRVPENERKERLDICNQCNKFNNESSFCQECGCHIPSKSLFYFSECPLNKWPIRGNNAE